MSSSRPLPPACGTRGLLHWLTMPLPRLLDGFFPRLCCVCRCRLEEDEHWFCTACFGALPRPRYRDTANNPLARRFWGVAPIARAATAFRYTGGGVLSRAVWSMKYFHNRRIGLFLGRTMAHEPLVARVLDETDVLLPMPLTRWRQWWRGYNQCKLLCDSMAQERGLTIVANAVRRTKFDGSQTHKNMTERRKSVEGAFAMTDDTQLRGRRVTVVDDIITTGSTISALLDVLVRVPGIRLSVIALAQTEMEEG